MCTIEYKRLNKIKEIITMVHIKILYIFFQELVLATKKNQGGINLILLTTNVVYFDQQTPDAIAWHECQTRMPDANAWCKRLMQTPDANAWRERLQKQAFADQNTQQSNQLKEWQVFTFVLSKFKRCYYC